MKDHPDQFDARFAVEPVFTHNPGNLKKQAYVEQEQARQQAALPRRPANIAWFEGLLQGPVAPRGERPRAGYLCNLVPPEILAAAGAEPVRLDCGNAAASVSGEETLSGDICPLVKATFGMFLRQDSLANTCDVLIVPSSCDGKRKLGEVLNDYKPVFVFNLPPEQDHERYAAAVADEFERLGRFLKQHLGRAPDRRALRREIESSNRRSALVRRLQDARAACPAALSIRDFFLILQASQFRPGALDAWLGEAEKVLHELEAAREERRSLKPRLILTGAPVVWPNFKILNVLEECGAEIVADTLCTGAQTFLDPARTDEFSLRAQYRALAARNVFGAYCPCFLSQTRRLQRVLDLCDQYRARGVVNYSLRLCQLFDVENYRLERVLKARRTPFLNVRTDYSLEDTEQLRVRVEAFLETL